MINKKKEEKINEIITSLREMNIEEVSEMFGYKNQKVLKSIMNRYGYTWNNSKNTFIKKEMQTETNIPAVSTVIEKIINDLDNNNGNLKETLKITNFKNIPELAIYMKENNYKWNGSIKNYVQVTGTISGKNQKLCERSNEVSPEKNVTDIEHTIEDEKILLFIKNNKEQIRKLIFDGENTSNSIPRYYVSGRNITKSLYMIDSVADLIGKFSMKKHISQGEVAMIAFIEFFKKYGFEHEINKISD